MPGDLIPVAKRSGALAYASDATSRAGSRSRTLRPRSAPSGPDHVELGLNFGNPLKLNFEITQYRHVGFIEYACALIQTVDKRVELAARNIRPFSFWNAFESLSA